MGRGSNLECDTAVPVDNVDSFLTTTVSGYALTLIQFDNCLSVPNSTAPFLLLLVLVPVLIFYTEGPLFPFAWMHLQSLWEIANTDNTIYADFLGHWWSWCLGPIPRYTISIWMGML